jgi:hypothetical protein
MKSRNSSKLAAALLALLAVGCATGDAHDSTNPDDELLASQPQALFDTQRDDVRVVLDEQQHEVGFYNDTYRLFWDFERGYAQFDQDDQMLWGFDDAIDPGALHVSFDTQSSELGVQKQALGVYRRCVSNGPCYICYDFRPISNLVICDFEEETNS